MLTSPEVQVKSNIDVSLRFPRLYFANYNLFLKKGECSITDEVRIEDLNLSKSQNVQNVQIGLLNLFQPIVTRFMLDACKTHVLHKFQYILVKTPPFFVLISQPRYLGQAEQAAVMFGTTQALDLYKM